jgi:putative salt-induced outer membrane protein YdiY
MITYRAVCLRGARAVQGGVGAAKVLLPVLLTCAAPAAAAPADEKALEAATTLCYQGRGGNTQNHGGAADAEAEYTRGRFIFDGAGSYSVSASDGKKNGESVRFSAGVKYFLTAGERFYGRYKAEWHRNVFSGFEYRFYNFAGPGVYLLKSDAQELSVEGGPNYVREDYPDASGEGAASFAAARLGADYQVFLTGPGEIDASATWDLDLKNTTDQLFAAGVTLRVHVARWLAVTATEKIDWDNVPPEGYGSLDVTTTFGCTLRNY